MLDERRLLVCALDVCLGGAKACGAVPTRQGGYPGTLFQQGGQGVLNAVSDGNGRAPMTLAMSCWSL
jgi:hypothetical protein